LPRLFPARDSCCIAPPASPAAATAPAPASDSDNYDSEPDPPSPPESASASASASASPPLARARFPFETVYHSFEHDRLAMAEQQQLEQADRDVAQHSFRPSLGAAQLSLKHLLAAIDANRSALAVSDSHLRALLPRSPQASEDRFGQEELYEAAEKVLLELRGYTEHSTPFLNKVSKREAPDYFDFIKSPMDLGTAMKKLKTLQYSSKAEFVDDLLLIWSNCLLYNADPCHFMRTHAIAMRKKTLDLVQFIPDITIRDRPDLDPEEDENSDQDLPKRIGKKSVQKKHPSRKSQIPLPPVRDSPPPQPSPPQQNTLIPCSQIEKEESSRDEDGDLSTQIWRTETRKQRAILCGERHQLFKDDRLQPDMPALERTPHLMLRFLQFEQRHAGQNMEEINLNMDDLINEIESKEMKTDDSAFAEYQVSSGIPELVSQDDDAFYQQSSGISLHPCDPRISPPRTGTSCLVDANLRQLYKIRKVCLKISAVKQMATQSFIHPHHYKQYDSKEFLQQDGQPSYFLETPLLFQRGYCIILDFRVSYCPAGLISDFEPLALDAFAEITAEFFHKIASTIRLFSDNHKTGTRYSMEQVLLLSLNRNGIPDLDVLESYVKDDIERYGCKLQDINKKMVMFLAALLRPAAELGDENALFNGNNESFVNGDFSETTGEDFFGFKELGLDKEFGISSFSTVAFITRTRSKWINNKYQEPPPFTPISIPIAESQIGLIKLFLLSKLENFESGILLDDDDLPAKQRAPRLKLPPSGKISTPRKRNLTFGFANVKKKKKIGIVENGELSQPPESPDSSVAQ
ncbi:Transcriptional activator spt7, partial [Neolecta irregularis DAH-3]